MGLDSNNSCPSIAYASSNTCTLLSTTDATDTQWCCK
jgi:hypothetical protein